MTGIYYTDLLDVLRAAGCAVAESATTNGWQRRARSSGGFAAPPLGVQWHHTASSTAPANDLSYMINGNADAPVGNLLLDRTGTYWPIAAGAANTAGKGGPLAMSRGTVKQDQANATTFAIEAANNGVGEVWPTAQIDAYFAGSNALNARFGNPPTDVFNHNTWAPTRKIDPATAAAVQGAWRPSSSTSSGTWTQADVTAGCLYRSSSSIAPPPPPEDDDVTDDDIERIAARSAELVWGFMLTGRNGFPDSAAADYLADVRAFQNPTEVWAQIVPGRGGYPDAPAQDYLVDIRRGVTLPGDPGYQ